MNRAANIVLKVVGVVGILCAVFGIWYNFISFSAVTGKAAETLPDREKIPFFYPAFYTMSGICICFYGLLIFFGVEFVRGRTRHLRNFTTLLIVEVSYYFITMALWRLPGMGMSIAAATGVSNGGLVVQLIILFPLWAPLATLWVRRGLGQPTPGA